MAEQPIQSANESFLQEVEEMVMETRERNLTPDRLVQLQTDIAAMSYFMATLLQQSELRAMDAEDDHSKQRARTVIALMDAHAGLAKNKADEEVRLIPAIDDLRRIHFRAKTEHTGMKERCRKIELVLQGLTMRISRLNKEQRNTSMTQQHLPDERDEGA